MAWIKSYSKIYQDISKEQVWKMWTNVESWSLWNPGIEYAKIYGAFEVGNYIVLKPLTMKTPVKIDLVEVVKGIKFTDCTSFPLAKMYGEHCIESVDGGVKLTTTIRVTGFLKYLWIWLIANKVAEKMPRQMDKLVELVNLNNSDQEIEKLKND